MAQGPAAAIVRLGGAPVNGGFGVKPLRQRGPWQGRDGTEEGHFRYEMARRTITPSLILSVRGYRQESLPESVNEPPTGMNSQS